MKAKSLSILVGALVSVVALTLTLTLMASGDARVNARVLHVDRDAPGPTRDGLSWTTAFTEVQVALAISLSGDEIWVAEGVYYPDCDPGSKRYTGYVTATFLLKAGVALYGGFAGTETTFEQRDWTANVTVLSGDLDRNDVTDPHGVVTTTQHLSGTNAWSVVSAYGAESAVLDGFAVTGGNANGSVPPGGDWWDPARCGGGMNINGIPTLRNLTVSGNSAADGGGMFSFISSAPKLNNVLFSGNSATGAGGGMFTCNNHPKLVNVIFTGNSADAGGGIYNTDYGNPTLINVTFSGNVADYGGAMFNFISGPVLTNCILWDNTASSGGSQIHNSSSTPTVFYSDVQDSGGSGAGWDATLGTDGGGNIDADPLFVDATAENLRPWQGSPVVDAGSNSAIPPDVAVDFDHNPRFVDVPIVPDTGSGTPPIVDMGAYEVQSSTATHVFTVEICTDENWYEPSTGQPAVIQSVGPDPGGVYDIPNAAPIWGQDDGPNSSTLLTRSFTLPVNAANVTGMAAFVADDGVTLTLNLGQVGNYDAATWPPPATRVLTNLQPGRNELRAAVYNRPGLAWFEACATIIYEQWHVYLPLMMRE
jgi:hypothetical protein